MVQPRTKSKSPSKTKRGTSTSSVDKTLSKSTSNEAKYRLNDLGTRIGVLVQRAGGAYAFARTIGATHSLVYRWQKGYAPNGEYLIAILNQSGCDPAWLMLGKGEPFPAPQIADPSKPVIAALVKLLGIIQTLEVVRTEAVVSVVAALRTLVGETAAGVETSTLLGAVKAAVDSWEPERTASKR